MTRLPEHLESDLRTCLQAIRKARHGEIFLGIKGGKLHLRTTGTEAQRVGRYTTVPSNPKIRPPKWEDLAETIRGDVDAAMKQTGDCR